MRPTWAICAWLPAAWLPDCMVSWLPGCLAAWLSGSRAAWPQGGQIQSHGTLPVPLEPRFWLAGSTWLWIPGRGSQICLQNPGSSGTGDPGSGAVFICFWLEMGFVTPLGDPPWRFLADLSPYKSKALNL